MAENARKSQLTCPICGQLFTVQDNLTEHLADDHGMADL